MDKYWFDIGCSCGAIWCTCRLSGIPAASFDSILDADLPSRVEEVKDASAIGYTKLPALIFQLDALYQCDCVEMVCLKQEQGDQWSVTAQYSTVQYNQSIVVVVVICYCFCVRALRLRFERSLSLFFAFWWLLARRGELKQYFQMPPPRPLSDENRQIPDYLQLFFRQISLCT